MRQSLSNLERASFIIFFGWLGLTQPLLAQEIRFKQLSIKDGLSQNTVNCMLQDHHGFMWFGTQDGLNFFDGYTFTVYRNDPDDSTSISVNYLQTLFEDKQGQLWVGTRGGGLDRFDYKTKTFEHFKKNENKATSLSNNDVLSIFQDHNGKIWIGTAGGGLNLFDSNAKAFKHYVNDPKNPLSLPDNNVTSIYEDHNDQLWIGTQSGVLSLFDSKTNTFISYKSDFKNTSPSTAVNVQTIFEDHSGKLWIGTSTGLNFFDLNSKMFEKFTNDTYPILLPKSNVTAIYEDHTGKIWVGTNGGGLGVYDPKSQTLESYQNDPRNPFSLSDKSVLSIYEDRSGRIWIGTYSGGLSVFDVKSEIFEIHNNDPEKLSTLSSNTVYSIYEDHNRDLWVGTTDSGLNRFNQQNGTVEVYQNNPGNPTTLSSNRVYSIYEDSNKNLWVGTNEGLNLFDSKTKTFSHYKNDPKDTHSLSNNFVKFIFQDHLENLWLGTYGGLDRFDPKTKSFRHYKNDPINPKSISSNSVWSIYEDHSGRLWIGTRGGGLNLFDSKTETFERFVNNPKDPSSLSDNYILSIAEASRGRLWIGTFGGGLNLFDPMSKTSQVFREKQGLPNDIIYGILEDGQGRLWLSTNNGISRFTPSGNTSEGKVVEGIFKNYDITDGLQSNEFNQSAYFKANNGKMYFGGINGFNTFHPDRIQEDPYVPPVVLTDIEIFNKPIEVSKVYDDFVLPISITEAGELVLSFKESVFTLEFSVLSYARAEKNKYAYKLDGFDKEWNYTDAKRRFATYTNLDPGTYVFQVKGSNHDGIWNEEGRTLTIIITPPWWGTWWFRTLLVFGIISSIILVFILRTQSIRRINRKLEETVQLKTKQIQDQNKVLTEQSEEMAAQNEELVQSQEEIATQRDLVSKHNELLEEEVSKRTQELVEYNHQLEQFAFISAHNLRAPVARILGLGQILDLAKNNPEEKDMIYPKLVYTARELDGVVKDLNSILELKKNNASFITDIAFETEVSLIRGNLEQEISVTGTTITTDFRQVSSLRTVKPYLDSIFYNLISNAIKYRHPDRVPVIHIQTEKLENEVCLRITDNGLGIDLSQFRDKLFTIYQRFHLHVEGKGMGLYLVRTQMAALGGRIEIESEVDKGTTFKAYFKV